MIKRFNDFIKEEYKNMSDDEFFDLYKNSKE